MGTPARICALSILCLRIAAYGDAMRGTVSDAKGSPVAGAQVSAVNQMGVFARTATDTAGDFELNVPDVNTFHLMITAPGFETKTVYTTDSTNIHLTLAPVSDSLKVPGSVFDVTGDQSGMSVTVIPGEEIRERNEAQALELLRYVPGLFVAQSGARGAAVSMSIRGGDPRDNLVEIDGVPVNSFHGGGFFDFAQIPADLLSAIDVTREPESAIYGSYAMAGVVNFETRSPADGARIDVLAEGGSDQERRFALGGSGTIFGVGIAGSLSRLDSDGPARNSAYRDENVFLDLSKRWGKQSISGFGDYDASKVGEPGPYGLNPVSNMRSYFSDYGLHYLADLNNRLRQEIFGAFSLDNNAYVSPAGFSYNKDIRGQAEERTTWNVLKGWTTAAGFVYAREEVTNTFVVDAGGRTYPLRRDDEGIYWDNQIQIGKHFHLNAGVREEVFEQARGQTYSKFNPKVSAAYIVGTSRLHGSFGTGMRPPGASELAFTTNPNLRPEKSLSGDIGIELKFLAGKLSLDGTYFYNSYRDLIMVPASLLFAEAPITTLGRARSSGEEITARLRPARWFSIGGSYTHLNTAVLAVEEYLTVGQALPGRPANSGEVTSTFTHGRMTANLLGYFRGSTMDLNPISGAAGGFFRDHGYHDVSLNANFDVSHGVTVYGNLRNLLNERYDEVYGYRAQLLNFVTGVKWNLPGSGK